MADDLKALAPLVAGGGATEAERELVEAAAEADAELAAELRFWRHVAAADAPDPGERSPGEAGWRRLEATLDAESEGVSADGAEIVDIASRRTAGRSGGWWRPVAIAACLALAAQTVLVLNLPTETTPPGMLEPAGDGVDAAYALQLTFRPDATELQIRELLLEVGATLIDGPSAIGVYHVGFASAEARDQGLATLSARGNVVETASK